MLKLLAGAAALAFVVAAGGHSAAAAGAKYTFALVPKSMNNPFYDQALAGCRKAEKDLHGEVKCYYIGPGEHGGGEEQAQIVADLIAKHVDGIGVSPANAAAIAHVLPRAKQEHIPVLTWDSDVLPKDKALRIAYIGTHNYEIGVNLAKIVMKIKPKGGTICIQSGGAAAENHNERMQGIRDTLAGKPSKTPPGDRLTGQNGWTEVAGCPLYTNDDFPLSVQQMEDILGKYPHLDAFVPTGGFPQFVPQAYRRVASKYKSRIQSHELALVVADTLPNSDSAHEGRSVARPGGTAAVRDGLRRDGGAAQHQGRQGRAEGPDLYRARCLHAAEREHLHRREVGSLPT